MPENRYSVCLRCGERLVTVNTFTEGKSVPAVILPLAIERAIEVLDQTGITAAAKEFTLLKIEDRGVWPEF